MRIVPDQPTVAGRSGPFLALFFFSGAAALIYQVVWVRMLGLVFGVTAFAIATVLASFMAGLAFGNYYFGKRADRHEDPLRLYALLELGIGIFGVCFPLILELVKIAYVALHAHFHLGFASLTLVRFLLSFLVLFVPTTLMGGTLPVIAKYLIRKRATVGSEIGDLYSANNLGAVAGCLAAGFVLIMLLGVKGTLYAAATINLLAALAAWVLGGGTPTARTDHVLPGGDESDIPAGEDLPPPLVRLVLWLFVVEGFVALAYEVVWVRILSASVLVNSVYSFSIVTASFILGLALGSFIVARLVDKIKDLLSLFAGVEIAVGFSSIGLLVLFTGLPAVRRIGAGSMLSGFWGRNVALEFMLSFLVLLVPATLMGMLFPVVTRLYTVNLKAVGHRVGVVGGLNTAGSIAGSLAGGFVLIPALGMYRSILVLAGVNVLLGVVPLCANPLVGRKLRTSIAGIALALFGGVVALIPRTALYWRNMTLSGSTDKLVYYHEDYAATVSVVQGTSPEGTVKLLDVDGIPVAGTERMLRTTQKCQAHIPLLLYEVGNHAAANNILIVGVGSGGTSWSASLHDSATITCVELVPGVVRAAVEQFTEENHGVFDNPRYTLRLGDGRNWLLAAADRYDVILTESVHPIYAGNASLYSRDYFVSCRNRLTSRGVVSVWLPIYRISGDDFKTVLATFQSVFPHCTVWFTSNSLSRQVLLVGTMQDLTIGAQTWRQQARAPSVRADLGELDLDDPWKLLSFLAMTEADIREYASGAALHTDNFPRLEFSAPRSGNDLATWKENLAGIAAHKRSDVAAVVTGDSSGVLSRYAGADSLVLQGMLHHFDDQASALRAYRSAMQRNPGDRTIAPLAHDAEQRLAGPLLAKANQLSRERSYREAAQTCSRILALLPHRKDIAAQMAVCLGSSGQVDSARAELNPRLDADSSWAAGFCGLGVVYVRNRMFDEAIGAFDRAIALDSRSAEAYSTRGIAYAGKGLLEKAIDDLDKAVQLAPDEPVPYENRSYVYARMGKNDLAAQDREKARLASTSRMQDRRAQPRH